MCLKASGKEIRSLILHISQAAECVLIEGNLIYPRVVGSSVGLPSIWVLAAVSIGASLMGIVGMLVFIPIVSVLYALLRGDVYEHLEKKGIAVDRESGEIYRPKEPDVDES